MSASDGLPRQFLSSLQILFDILDENRTGLVRLCDIESRWSDDGVRGLPLGVVDGLRKVAPPNGLLTFDRFVAGLKLVLAGKRKEISESYDVERQKGFISNKENRFQPFDNQQRERGFAKHDDNSIKNMRDIRQGNSKPHSNARDSNFQAALPNHSAGYNYNSSGNNGTLSRQNERRYNDIGNRQTNEGQRKSPHIQPVSTSNPLNTREPTFAIKADVSSYPNTIGSVHANTNNSRRIINTTSAPSIHHEKPPAIPPRSGLNSQENSNSTMKKSMSGPDLQSRSPPAVPPRERQSSTRVLTELKNWQKEWKDNNMSGRNDSNKYRPRKSSDDAIYANLDQFQGRVEKHQQNSSSQNGPSKATVRRHGSGRRHTLADGIDQNMLKRMKQLEEETSILRSGLTMVETAREWYKKQLASVTDKQAMLGKVSYNDNSVEAYQERTNFQKARIAEVNQHLRLLVESSEKGFPLHMNLAIPNSRGPGGDANLRSLTEQNRRLMEELEQKREQTRQLEQEKSSLVRELFESRSKHQTPNFDDTTFM